MRLLHVSGWVLGHSRMLGSWSLAPSACSESVIIIRYWLFQNVSNNFFCFSYNFQGKPDASQPGRVNCRSSWLRPLSDVPGKNYIHDKTTAPSIEGARGKVAGIWILRDNNKVWNIAFYIFIWLVDFPDGRTWFTTKTLWLDISFHNFLRVISRIGAQKVKKCGLKQNPSVCRREAKHCGFYGQSSIERGTVKRIIGRLWGNHAKNFALHV